MNKETLSKLKADVEKAKADRARGYGLQTDTLLELIALAERTTSPVSQMKDAEIIEKIDRPGFAWENLDAPEQRNLLGSIRDLLAAAAPHAQAPAEQQESITSLLSDLYDAGFDSPSRSQSTPEYRRIRDAIITHIDAHTAAAVAKAREEGFEEGKRLAHEQACKVTHALMAERDEQRQRAERAEAALAQPVDLSKLEQRTMHEVGGGVCTWVRLSDVERSIQAKKDV